MVPLLVTWKMPRRLSVPSVTMAAARSAVKVGEPCWSSTKRRIASPSASRRAVLTMLDPWAPQTHDVRTMVDPGGHSRSPASLLAP